MDGTVAMKPPDRLTLGRAVSAALAATAACQPHPVGSMVNHPFMIPLMVAAILFVSSQSALVAGRAASSGVGTAAGSHVEVIQTKGEHT